VTSLARIVRSPFALRLAALAVAAYFGLAVPVAHLVRRPKLFAFDTAPRADAALGVLRTRLAPGERIGIMLGSGNVGTDEALWYSAQYALVPAIVTPIPARDCRSSVTAPPCRVREVKRFFVADAGAWAVLERLGVAPVDRAGKVPIFAGGMP
jgi:hypothetical protein